MDRTSIAFPETTHFVTKIPVRIGDINYGNHAGNDAIVSILHESRVQFLHSMGYTELDIEGVGLIMTDLQVQYKKQILYGDQLTVSLSMVKTSAKSFALFYQIDLKPALLAVLAKTNFLGFNYSTQKITALPDALFAKLVKL